MLALSLLYYLDDQGFFDDFWEAVLQILSQGVPDPWARIFRIALKLYQIWRKFEKIYKEAIADITDKIGQILDDANGGMLSALGDTLSKLANDILALVAEEALTTFPIFHLFSLKMREGYDEQAFLWSDMAHYRRTSAIPERLVSRARDMLKSEETREHGEQLLAFALGWVCHVGTDVVAHSFVNEQCGGPFRTHWQRHHLLETHIDAWNYQCTKDNTLPRDDFVAWQEPYDYLAKSALYFAVQIPRDMDELGGGGEKQGDLRQPLPEGDDQASSRDRREELLDTDGAVPPLAGRGHRPDACRCLCRTRRRRRVATDKYVKGTTRLIEKWLGILGVDGVGMSLEDLREIVAPDPTGIKRVPEGFPMSYQMMATYRFMLSWLKRAYMSSFTLDRPAPPPKFFTVPPDDLNFPPPPDFGGVDSDDDPVSQTCETLASLLDFLWKTLKKAAQPCYDFVKMIAPAATYFPREAIYYGLTLPLWTAAENMRMVLAHLGFPDGAKREAEPEHGRPAEGQ